MVEIGAPMKQSEINAQPPKMQAELSLRSGTNRPGISIGSRRNGVSDVRFVSRIEWVAQGIRDGDDMETYGRKMRWLQKNTGAYGSGLLADLVRERISGDLPAYLAPPAMEQNMLDALVQAGIDPEPYFTSGKWSRPQA
jgi:hypothetical protein